MKRLYRSKSDRVVAGVCGGLARYFNIDPTIIRVVFVIAVLLGGLSIFAYIISIFIIPEEPAFSHNKDSNEYPSSVSRKSEDVFDERPPVDTPKKWISTEIIVGIAFTIIGVFALFSALGWFSISQLWRYFWPGLIVIVGVAILFGSFRK